MQSGRLPRQAFWVVGLVAALSGAHARGQDEREISQALSDFRKTIRNAKVDEQIVEAIKTLGQKQHPKILDEWEKVLPKVKPEHRLYVVAEIRKYVESSDARKILLDALSEEGGRAQVNARGQDVFHETACEILRALKDLKTPPEKREHSVLVGLLRHDNISLSSTAVQVCGELKCWAAVDPLLGLLRDLEQSEAKPPNLGDPNGGGQFVRRGGTPSPSQDLAPDQLRQLIQYRRRSELPGSIRATLSYMFGETKKNHAEYSDYWKANRDRLIGK